MKPLNALRLYGIRVRARLLQECFALVGIAAGVALLFASQISSSSLSNSVSELSRGILGKTSLQMIARDPHGFPQSTLARVSSVPGVLVAAPLVEVSANAIGPNGSESVELIGADQSLARLGGSLTRRTQLQPFGGSARSCCPLRSQRPSEFANSARK